MMPYGIKNGTKLECNGAWYILKRSVLYRTNAPDAPSRAKRIEEANPYKKSWNSVDDEESFILNSVRNGTLFVPTPLELAERHRSTEKYYRVRATQSGPVVGFESTRNADIQARMVKTMTALDEEIKNKKRAKEFTFSVKEN